MFSLKKKKKKKSKKKKSEGKKQSNWQYSMPTESDVQFFKYLLEIE